MHLCNGRVPDYSPMSKHQSRAANRGGLRSPVKRQVASKSIQSSNSLIGRLEFGRFDSCRVVPDVAAELAGHCASSLARAVEGVLVGLPASKRNLHQVTVPIGMQPADAAPTSSDWAIIPMRSFRSSPLRSSGRCSSQAAPHPGESSSSRRRDGNSSMARRLARTQIGCGGPFAVERAWPRRMRKSAAVSWANGFIVSASATQTRRF